MSPVTKIYFILSVRVLLLLGTPGSAAADLNSKCASPGAEGVQSASHQRWYVSLEESTRTRHLGASYRKRFHYEPTRAQR